MMLGTSPLRAFSLMIRANEPPPDEWAESTTAMTAKYDPDALWLQPESGVASTTSDLIAFYEDDIPGLRPSDYLEAIKHAEAHGCIVSIETTDRLLL